MNFRMKLVNVCVRVLVAAFFVSSSLFFKKSVSDVVLENSCCTYFVTNFERNNSDIVYS